MEHVYFRYGVQLFTHWGNEQDLLGRCYCKEANTGEFKSCSFGFSLASVSVFSLFSLFSVLLLSLSAVANQTKALYCSSHSCHSLALR